MNTNCLITKLKGIVDNENLPQLNKLKIHINASDEPNTDNRYLRIFCSDVPFTMKLTNGALFTTSFGDSDGVSEVTVPALLGDYYHRWITNVECDLIIESKYDYVGITTSLTMDTIKAADVAYCKKLLYLYKTNFDEPIKSDVIKAIYINKNIVGDFANINLGNLSIIDITNSHDTKVQFNSNMLAENIKLVHFRCTPGKQGDAAVANIAIDMADFANKPITYFTVDKEMSAVGDIKYLAQGLLTRTDEITASNTLIQFSNSGVEGSIQEFVNTLVDGGKTSGSILMPYVKVTNNVYADLEKTQKIKDDTNIPTSEYTKLTWVADKTWTIAE